ncbi:MAG: TOBE domain-containing protein [Nitrincola lacisaponensis]|uniref:TOBE domain-containing protein n=1 Tax=Nitrincola lacisaponensis TaxID=267850 RepID=UPI00391B3715
MHYEFSERFISRLSLENNAGAALSDTRIRLLEQIDQLGSISQAAKSVPLSYKAAWDAIDLLNNTAPEPLVVRSAGGRQGGGTRLTEYGRRMVVMYRALEMEYQSTLDRVMAGMNEMHKGDLKEFQQLMHRMAMKPSARNQFTGRVSGLRDSGLDYLVHLQLTDEHELVAIITKTSAEYLGLSMGADVFALFKAYSVVLTTNPEQARGFANQLWGVVEGVNLSRDQVEVILQLPGERRLVSLIQETDFQALNLKPGDKACACIDPEQILLAAYD